MARLAMTSVELAGDDLVTGGHDGVGLLSVQLPHRQVGKSRRLFDLGHGNDKLGVHPVPCDVKVFLGPQGLHPVIGLFGDLLVPDGVMLQTKPGSFFLHDMALRFFFCFNNFFPGYSLLLV